MQLKKQMKKANFRAIQASGDHYCDTCHKRTRQGGCRNKKCPVVRAEKIAVRRNAV